MLADNRLDIVVLRALIILLEERNVSRAAVRLSLSQPAASHLLNKLRLIFNDPLLVRGNGGMALTRHAEGLLTSAPQALAVIDALLAPPGGFDPATSRHSFTIAFPDHPVPTIFRDIVGEFRRRAPNAFLELRALTPDYDFEQALEAGKADLVISNWPKPPDYLYRSTLFEDSYVCLVDENHPFVSKPPSVQDYLDAVHLAPADYSVTRRGVVENHLSTMRLKRDRRIVLGYFSIAPYLVPGTDLVFTTTNHFASYFESMLPVKVVASPINFPKVEFYQLWHERMHVSPPHQWLRQLVAKVVRPGRGCPGEGRAGASQTAADPV